MQFYILTAILCAVFASSMGDGTGISPTGTNIWLTVGLPSCLPSIFAIIICVLKHNVKPQISRQQNCLENVERLSMLIWFAATIWICFGTNWGMYTASISASTTISTAVFLLPILVSISLLWLILSMAMESKLADVNWRTGIQRVWLLIKLQLLTILVPLGMLMIANDLVNLEWDASQSAEGSQILSSANLQFIALPTVIFAIVCLMPMILCWILPTRSISETTLGRQLLVLAHESETAIREIRIWHTGNRVLNGLVVGLLPIGRKILLTDRLINLMDADQIAAVFLHEVGHAKRNHMLIRFLAASFPMVGGYMVLSMIGLGELFAVVVSMIGAAVVFGWVARSLEFDADQFASVQLTRLCGSNQNYIQALEIIRADEPKSDRFSWLHPTVSLRIQRLAAMAPTPVLNSSKL